MKTLFAILLVIGFKQLAAQEVWTDRSKILPDQLRNIPTAIFLNHSPGLVFPEINKQLKTFDGKYVWKHSTTIYSNGKDLVMVAAGSYIWTATKGWITNIKFSKADFSELFNCKNGIIKANKAYIFKENYRFGDELYAGDALWYIIAKDKNGVLYKGIGIVETEDKLKTN